MQKGYAFEKPHCAMGKLNVLGTGVRSLLAEHRRESGWVCLSQAGEYCREDSEFRSSGASWNPELPPAPAPWHQQ